MDFLEWIGAYAVAREPDVIIHLGDFADMPSLSSYDKGKRSMEGRRYVEDIEAAHDGWDIFTRPIYARLKRRTRWRPRFIFLRGNHEDRITRAVEHDPQLEGVLGQQDLPWEDDERWEVHPFLQPVFVDGVGYAHYWYRPNSGRPYAGSIESRLKNIGHSFTQGHEQTFLHGSLATYRGAHHGLVAGACYLHDESYKGPQGNEHWRGVIMKHEVKNGDYDLMQVSLNYLAKRYGNTTFAKARTRLKA